MADAFTTADLGAHINGVEETPVSGDIAHHHSLSHLDTKTHGAEAPTVPDRRPYNNGLNDVSRSGNVKNTPKIAMTQAHVDGLDESSGSAPNQPVVARMWNTFQSGTHSYAVDRQAAAEVEKAVPNVKAMVAENRGFLLRAVRWLAKNDIVQFIDIGSGLPSSAGSTHETALKVNAHVRVLYVDIEETVVKDGKGFIQRAGLEEQMGMIRADALKPEEIMHHTETRRIIEFDKPVGLVMGSLVHFFQHFQYVPMLDFWKAKLAQGSALVMTHVTTDNPNTEGVQRVVEIYKQTPTPAFLRSRAEIKPIMDGWEVVEPGLVRPHIWKMEVLDEEEPEPEATFIHWVAVGRLLSS